MWIWARGTKTTLKHIARKMPRPTQTGATIRLTSPRKQCLKTTSLRSQHLCSLREEAERAQQSRRCQSFWGSCTGVEHRIHTVIEC